MTESSYILWDDMASECGLIPERNFKSLTREQKMLIDALHADAERAYLQLGDNPRGIEPIGQGKMRVLVYEFCPELPPEKQLKTMVIIQYNDTCPTYFTSDMAGLCRFLERIAPVVTAAMMKPSTG